MENFNLVYTNNHKMVLTFMMLKTNEYTIAEELANDVFMKVHKNLANYDEKKAKMKTWVMKIAKNTVIDHYRKNSLDVISLDNSTTNDEDNKMTIIDKMSTSINPHKEFVSNEVYDIIQDEISSLDGKYRDVADLFFNEELSYEDIGLRLNLPLGTVKGQISRARAKLVERLQSVRV